VPSWHVSDFPCCTGKLREKTWLIANKVVFSKGYGYRQGIGSGIGRGIRKLPPLLAILPQTIRFALGAIVARSIPPPPLRKMEPRIAPHDPASAPEMTSRLFESVKPGETDAAGRPAGRLSAIGGGIPRL